MNIDYQIARKLDRLREVESTLHAIRSAVDLWRYEHGLPQVAEEDVAMLIDDVFRGRYGELSREPVT